VHNSNKSYTFPFENRKNIAVITLSPDANILLTVDEGASPLFFYFCGRSDCMPYDVTILKKGAFMDEHGVGLPKAYPSPSLRYGCSGLRGAIMTAWDLIDAALLVCMGGTFICHSQNLRSIPLERSSVTFFGN
jgi:hypothetical protein